MGAKKATCGDPSASFPGSAQDCASDASGSGSGISAAWTPRSCMARLHGTGAPVKGSSAGTLPSPCLHRHHQYIQYSSNFARSSLAGAWLCGGRFVEPAQLCDGSAWAHGGRQEAAAPVGAQPGSGGQQPAAGDGAGLEPAAELARQHAPAPARGQHPPTCQPVI